VIFGRLLDRIIALAARHAVPHGLTVPPGLLAITGEVIE